MRRLSALTFIVIAVAGIAAPVPPDAQKRVLYFPTTVGTKWVYDDNGSEGVEVIEKAEKKDGKFVISINYTRGEDKLLKSQILISEQALVHVLEFENKPHPLTLLKLPTKLDEQWLDEIMAEKIKVVQKIGAIEDVEVPAGKFRTVRVDATITFTNHGGRIQKSSAWYAPDVGEVKHVIYHESREHIKVLKSFTPGKK